MDKNSKQNMDGYSQTPLKERLEALRSLIPEAFAEGKIDWEKLKAALGEEVNFSNERYVLNWAGKSDAFRIMQQPSAATLVPCKEESVDFDNTENIFIEGENMEVLKVLQKSYFGKVKMIYIDPPYNTGNDSFIYPDKFSETKEEYQKRVGDLVVSGQLSVGSGQKLETGNCPLETKNWKQSKDSVWQANRKENGQYHSNWLNMMMPRLYLAKSLLRDDGVILINMDEHEITNLQYLMNEIFGEENDLGTIVWDKRNPKGDATGIAYQHEYIVVFAKDAVTLKSTNDIIRPKKNAEKILAKAASLFQKYNEKNLDSINNEFQLWIREQKDFSGGESAYNQIDSEGNVFREVSMAWPNKKQAPDEYFIPLKHPITHKDCPVPSRGWRNPPQTMKELLTKGLIIFGKDEKTQPTRKYILKDNMFENIPSLLYYGGSDVDLLDDLQIPFETPKVTSIVKEHIQSFSNKDSIILDFFAGSGTTAHAVMQLNKEDGGHRKFICVQLPEPCDEKSEAYKAGYNTIAEISKERIRRAGRKVASGQLPVTSCQLPVTSDRKLETGNWKLTTKKWSEISKSLTDEEIKHYGCKELQRTRCLAKINGSGQASLFDCEETAQGGNICSIGPNEESGSIDSVKHSGGTRAELIGGICPVYLHSTGFAGGIGDTNSVMREHRLSETRGDSGNSSTVGGNRQDAECPCKGTLQCPIISGQLSVASGQEIVASDQEIVASGQLSVTSSQKLKTENWKLTTDAGFKVFKLSDSNFKPWRNIPGANKEEWKQQIIDFINPVAENATVENMVYELLLKSGKSLNSRIEKLSVASGQGPVTSGQWSVASELETGNCKLETTYLINGGELALLLESVSQATVDAVLSRHPQKVIALDKLFEGNDQLKTNTALQMRDAGVEFKTI